MSLKEIGLGQPIPNLPHAVSVSLPKWEDVEGYEMGRRSVVDRMTTGYPRFFLHSAVKELIRIALPKLSAVDSPAGLVVDALPFPSEKVAQSCHEFLAKNHCQNIQIAVIHLEGKAQDIYCTVFDSKDKNTAKEFWQHSGEILSSRRAQSACNILQDLPPTSKADSGEDTVQVSQDTRIPLRCSIKAKSVLRERVAELVAHSSAEARDVYLYPSGMSSIWNAHQLAMNVAGDKKRSVCFGFLYTDTLKILEKWGPGCVLYGNGTDNDMDLFEAELRRPDAEKILCVITEFPSNPLLRSADMERLWRLSKEFGFLLFVDETIGNFVNVHMLPFCDAIVSSLTKVFSGDTNVMAGSMILNPKSPRYPSLQRCLDQTYEDNLYSADAIILERNSRDCKARVGRMNITGLRMAKHMLSKVGEGVIKDVFYPKYQTPHHYEARLCEGGGYGSLFSVTFYQKSAAVAFYDALNCAKGPSLGSNFTLVCPYTLLGHFTELDWAESFGVDRNLVRVSVGLESVEDLISLFDVAVEAAAKMTQE